MLRMLSWNVRSLNDTGKRSIIKSPLRDLSVILFVAKKENLRTFLDLILVVFGPIDQVFLLSSKVEV